MTDNTQPEALRLAEYVDDLIDGSMVNYAIEGLENVAAELRRLQARIAELEAQLTSSGFTAADMATAESRGFRDGVASLSANAVEPVAWWIPKAEQFCLADKSGDRPFVKAWEPLYAAPTPQPAPATQQAGVALSDDLRDRLVAISAAIADQDDRAAQAMLREILKAPQADSVPAVDYPPLPTRRRTFLCYKCGGRECEPGTIGESHPPCKCGYLGFAEDLDFTEDQMRDFADRTHALRMQAAPKAADSVLEDAGGANWQDISTAPRDGTRFVAAGNNYGLYSETQHVCIAQWFRGCWMEVSDWNETSELKYLTHWMPLLPLPGNAARKQGANHD